MTGRRTCHSPLQYFHAVSGSGSRVLVPTSLFRSNVNRFVQVEISSFALLSKVLTPVLCATQSKPGREQTDGQEPGPEQEDQKSGYSPFEAIYLP